MSAIFELVVIFFMLAAIIAGAIMFDELKDIKGEIIRTRTQIKNELKYK